MTLTDMLFDNEEFMNGLVMTADEYVKECDTVTHESLEIVAHRASARLVEMLATQLKAAM